nr:probable serine/threonine-protein kinase pats1 [Dermatophagoides farinae]
MKIEQSQQREDISVETTDNNVVTVVDGCLCEKSSPSIIDNGDVKQDQQQLITDNYELNDRNLDATTTTTSTTISDTASESSSSNNSDDNHDVNHHNHMAGIIMCNNRNQNENETNKIDHDHLIDNNNGDKGQQQPSTMIQSTANHHHHQIAQQQQVPFPLLAGESLQHHETTNDYQIFLTNYRFFVKNIIIQHKRSSIMIPSSPQQQHLQTTTPSTITMNGGTTAVCFQNGINGHVTIKNNNNNKSHLNNNNNNNQLNYLQQQNDHRTNYHQHSNDQRQEFFIPINNIDWIEIRDIYFLTIYTKYIESFVLTFDNQESIQQWHKRLCDIQQIDINKLFCFQFYRELAIGIDNNHHNNHIINNKFINLFSNNQDVIEKLYRQSNHLIHFEFKRMNFKNNDDNDNDQQQQQSWRICDLNKDFKFCNSYPEYFIVPADITDKELEYIANFRYSRRIPVVVWRNRHNGCVIMRSSQPVVGWFFGRCNQDEKMLQKVLKICQRDTQYNYYGGGGGGDNLMMTTTKLTNGGNMINSNGTTTPALYNGNGNHMDHNQSIKMNGGGGGDGFKLLSNGGSTTTTTATKQQQTNHSTVVDQDSSNDDDNDDDDDDDQSNNNKLLILDARSYTAAFANRALGGGCECPEYYTNCDIQFMGLNNIHGIRKSFYNLRYICESSQIDQSNWYTLLDNTKWLHNLASLLKAAVVVVDAITIQERPVLVHCSDGWDRTPQVIALAELMLDPFYRTIDGFKILIEKEWLQYGHKFADRCRSSTLNIDPNERCPVFLQWVDCVHQLVKQFPREFEFNVFYLMKLVYHSYSCLFGTFTCNTVQERRSYQVYEKTISLWSYFEMNRANFINYLYLPTLEVLRPSCRVKDIIFWNEIYVPVSNNGTDVTNMAISSCNGICNHHGTASTAAVVSLNANNEQFDCQHETKCQSQSKCDLNRSASYESLANFDMKQSQPPPSTNYNDRNLPSSIKHFTDTTISSSSVTILNRHLSDTCLFKRSNQIFNNYALATTPYMTNGLMITDNRINCDNNDDMDEMSKHQPPIMNGLANNNNNINKHPNMMMRMVNDNGYDIEDCHLLSSTLSSSQNKPTTYVNCNGSSKTMMNHQPNNLSTTTTSTDSNLSTIFDIDGQIIGHNNNSRLQLQQLINYHKNMIKRLTSQLNFKKS